jgi:hypothetical protein
VASERKARVASAPARTVRSGPRPATEAVVSGREPAARDDSHPPPVRVKASARPAPAEPSTGPAEWGVSTRVATRERPRAGPAPRGGSAGWTTGPPTASRGPSSGPEPEGPVARPEKAGSDGDFPTPPGLARRTIPVPQGAP